MAAVRRSLLKVADTNIPILIEGESGTGKEIICKYLHQRSVWSRGPFVKVNCPAIPGTLLESELFGYERGAFTGAFGAKAGRVELAESGTLFLDEISELDPVAAIEAVAGAAGRAVSGDWLDRRKESQCPGDLRDQSPVAAGGRRGALPPGSLLPHHRTGASTATAARAPARICASLVEYFVALHNEQFKCDAPPISESSLLLMRTHPWTGNIRELENLTKRYVVVGTEEAILSEIGQRGLVFRLLGNRA